LSKDLEDIVTLFDGCRNPTTLLAECSDAAKAFIIQSFKTRLEEQEFLEAIEGNFRSDAISLARARIVLERMRYIAQQSV